MVLGITLFVVVALVVAIWAFLQVKKVRHKVTAIFLIGLIIFTYIGFSVSLKGKDINLSTASGVIQAGKLYFAWLGSVFTNIKSITAYATKKNWTTYNKSIVNKTTKVDEIWNKLQNQS